ncbi:MAG TPA: outer membrane protein assembly factor BamD [Chlorobaculum parvum]|uniref:Outer membrane protein assembly factor BamD n=1 Tax=Chlorobaculum parvum TaxID=274539 RepID=A0A7C5DEK1_9CHLB|nr:outer membrane protein assembly factor BamD [Chlorobaculum parvum]
MSQPVMRMPLRKILPGLFLLAVTLSSCSSSKLPVAQVSTVSQAESRYQQATDLIARKKYSKAIEVLESLLFSTRASNLEDDVLHSLANSYYQKKQYLLAADMYRRLLQQTPGSPFAKNAQFQLAKSYEKLSPFYELDQEYTVKAINEFATYLDEYPVDDSAQAQGDAELYKELLKVDPTNASYKAKYDAAMSQLSNEAPVSYSKSAILKLRDRLAHNRYSIAQQYVRLKKYRAADIYFDVIINQYPDTKWVKSAWLGKIDTSIRRSKWFEARQTIERFQQLYPANSKEVEGSYKKVMEHFSKVRDTES